MLPTTFRFIRRSGFREDFLEINQSETRIACCGHVCERIGTKWALFIKGLPWMLPTKFRSIWPSGFRGDDFLEIDQTETRIACGGHVYWTDQNYMSNLYRWPSNDASYHVSIHLAKWFQRRRFFRNRPIRNKNWLWRPCLLTDRN